MVKAKKSTNRLKKKFRYNGKDYYVYGYTKRELEEKYRKKLQWLEDNKHIIACDKSFKQYYKSWQESRNGEVSQATQKRQNHEVDNMARFKVDEIGTSFVDLKITEIDAETCKALQKFLMQLEKRNKKLTANTINGIMATLKHVLEDARKERVIPYNPTDTIKSLKVNNNHIRESIHRCLSIEETQTFFEYAKQSYYYNVFAFMLHTGCRCGEVGALTVADVDFKKNTIRINKTITKDITGMYYVGDNPKTKKSIRTIDLTESLKVIIKEQIDNNRILRDNIAVMPNKDYLFMSPEMSLLDDTCANREIARICKRANIERFTCHAFRDTFCTRGIENGVAPEVMQKILGHSTITMTMDIYNRVAPKRLTSAMNIIESAVGI